MTASDDLITLARLAGGLVVVLTLVYLSARVAKRGRLRRGESGLQVVDRVGLSRDAHLAVVEIAGRTLLLGVTPQAVTMISSLDDEPRALPATVTSTVKHAAHAADEAIAEIIADDDEGELVDEIGVDIVKPTGSARPDPVPAGVTLDGYPDLASALRAAGRTASPPENRMPVGPPRTRAEARRRSRALEEAERALAEVEAAQLARAAEKAVEKAQEKAQEPAGPRIPQQRTAKPRPARSPQATGSVLNPRTWQQGIEALREYTVRRG